MKKVLWKVTWTDQYFRLRTLTFQGEQRRIAAGIDFKLLLLNRREWLPSFFELEEQCETEVESPMGRSRRRTQPDLSLSGARRYRAVIVSTPPHGAGTARTQRV